MQSLWISLAILALGIGASAQRHSRPGYSGGGGSICENRRFQIPCSSDKGCQTICGSNYECVGCPNCARPSEKKGSCFLEGTVAIRCAGCPVNPPPPPPPACNSSSTTTCLTDGECKSKCGKSFECKKCPPNGCPGREVGQCVPTNEQIFCTLEICTDETQPVKPKCQVAGCSSQLCVNPNTQPTFTTCIFRPEFACYRKATCGNFGRNGSCGFKQTPELIKCLKENRDFGAQTIQG